MDNVYAYSTILNCNHYCEKQTNQTPTKSATSPNADKLSNLKLAIV